MQYQKAENTYFIRIDKDEDLFHSLEEFAQQEGLRSGHLSGIGALKNCELGFYHLHTKTYDKKVFPHEAELLSLDGNLSFLNGKPYFHIHTVLGGPDFQCYGGHLFSAQVAVTCEINFRSFNSEVIRIPNEKIGLNHLNFCGLSPSSSY
ncbi:MAG: DNA-binding protein [Bdellovibrionales bacterium]|nr:DNA-binding protein [Bdellovibrionales bacterium]